MVLGLLGCPFRQARIITKRVDGALFIRFDDGDRRIENELVKYEDYSPPF